MCSLTRTRRASGRNTLWLGGSQEGWGRGPFPLWLHGLCLDPADPGVSVEVRTCPVGEVPFLPEGAPIELRVTGRRVPEWVLRGTAPSRSRRAPWPQPSPVRS